MAYEYENDVISELEQMGVDYESNGYFNMSIEVEEVYAKAKAFDEILNIDLSQHDEEYADNVMKVVNKYTEDK
ncbi:hypothetical protein [Mammaliicoccus sciuri]|uniref:hypothetical protein n=1 Tax=Mammaliicoccus sciuri TaxID=1296 RepID=UPI000D1E6E49|nr:hypothetical protein [Mammaliicoccus sciuri]PTJ53918.1 hypothetical protein BU012_02380 [Mammaliicoccus sciuri]